MKYLKDFDYIIENMSQARKILKDNDINKEDERFKKITDKTNRDGYTGFITKLVFEKYLDIDSALNLYDDLKDNKIDIGSSKIKKVMDDNNMPSSKKIQFLVDLIRKSKMDKEKNNFELLFKSNGYNVYLINEYEGIMCTGSPAWCLKTKSMFNQYTKTKRGTQFVLIDSRLVSDNNELEITVPNTWDGNSYKNPGYESTRYGVTVFPSGQMEVFDDDNKQTFVTWKDKKIDSSNRLSVFVKNTLEEIYDYYEKEIKPFVPVSVDDKGVQYEQSDEFDTFKDITEELKFEVKGVDISFNYMVEYSSFDTDKVYKEFIDKLKEEMGLNTKEEIFDFMGTHKNRILGDYHFTETSGIFDLFLNDFLVYNFNNSADVISGEEEGTINIEGYDDVTKREIPLGGYWYDEQGVGEVVMKYHYGFQYDKYGKAAVLQGFETLTDYYAEMANNFYDILIEQEVVYFEFYSTFKMNNLNQNDFNVDSYKDGYKVTFDFNKLYENRTNKNDNREELMVEMVNELKPYFEYTKIEGNTIIVPICTNPDKSPE